MSCRCELTGISVQYGNNVSHSQRKSRRRFKPNIRNVVYRSETTGRDYRLKVVAKTMRTIEKCGGLDILILKAPSCLMSLKARKIKKAITQSKSLSK